MFLFGVLALLAINQVTCLNNQQYLKIDSGYPKDVLNLPELHSSENEPDINLIDSIKSRPGNEKSFISDVVLGYLIRELTRTANFPTLVASNISEQCHNDSQDYRTANFLLVNWANKSKSFQIYFIRCV